MMKTTVAIQLRGLPLLLALFCAFGWVQSAAAQDSALAYRDQVQKMFIAYYGRPGDPAGVDFWAQELAGQGGNLQSIVDAFGTSAEYEARYSGLDNETLVNNIYVNTLNRDADAEGLTFYVEQLASGEATLATIALDIANGIHEQSVDADTYGNKLAVAKRFTAAIASSVSVYGTAEITEAAALLAAVDSSADSLAVASSAVNDFASLADITSTAAGAAGFSTLVTALQATGLDAALADEAQTFTVFAPTDAAFAVLGEDTINALLGDTDTLSDILLYHVVGGAAVDSGAAIGLAGTSVETANGDAAAITLRDSGLYINNSLVQTTDIIASNGVIHVIDAVLLPPEPTVAAGTIVDVAVADGRFTTLVAALQATSLDAVLADDSASFTVFAPTDDAFAVLGEETINALLADTDTLSNILLYHVISGVAVDSITALSLTGSSVAMASGNDAALSVTDGALFINGAQVVIADIVTDNGVIHVIDAVIIPPEPVVTIVDAAVSAGSFTTLVAALQATGLDTVLADTSRQFTVFAPTDDAFAVLGEETIAGLLADPDTLANILLYHVVADLAVDADTALTLAGSNVEMANGAQAMLTLDGMNLFINDAQVTVTDIVTSNGIIHVIDAVILPPAM